MLGRFGEVEDAPLGGDRADQALAHSKPGDVDRFLAQAVRREQLEHVVAKEVDRADVAAHRLGDQVDDVVELGLRRAALGHDLVETGQDLPSGSGGGASHGARLAGRGSRDKPHRAANRLLLRSLSGIL